MNAIVEVGTAKVETVTGTITVVTTTAVFAPVLAPVVSASTVVVPSIAGTSISAVSPDYILIGGTA